MEQMGHETLSHFSLWEMRELLILKEAWIAGGHAAAGTSAHIILNTSVRQVLILPT